MKDKTFSILSIVLFAAFLAVIALSFLLPSQDYSVHEKRDLAAFPACSAENLFSGRFGSERFLHTLSISSMNTMQGAFFSASSNRRVTIFSASPT